MICPRLAWCGMATAMWRPLSQALVPSFGNNRMALSERLSRTGTTIQASRLRPMPGGHRLAAENPVTVIVGRRP